METPPRILPADPKASWLARRDEIDAAIKRVLESGRYILGPEVEAFEREWAAYVGSGFAVGVANGTDALELALRAAGIGPGDVVLTAANTVTATAAAIDRAGATLALGEIDPENFTLSIPALGAWLDSAKAPNLAAVVPVHLYGQPVDMLGLQALSKRHGFTLIEDAAQAHGARVGRHRVGGIGLAGAFSFYPTKNLGAIGDGGAVVTDDPGLAERVRSLRQYGWTKRYVADEPGMNSRLDEIQAAILRVKLRYLDEETERRREIAQAYFTGLANVADLNLPEELTGSLPVWHQFVVRHPQRDRLRRHLEAQGILCGILYPVPLHLQPAYRGRAQTPPDGLAAAELVCDEVISLPIQPELADADVGRIIAAVRGFFG